MISYFAFGIISLGILGFTGAHAHYTHNGVLAFITIILSYVTGLIVGYGVL